MSLFPATLGPTQCPSRRQLSAPPAMAPRQYSNTTLSRSPASPDIPFLSHRCYWTWPHWAEFLPVLTPPGTDLSPFLLVSLTLSDLPCSAEISISPGPFLPSRATGLADTTWISPLYSHGSDWLFRCKIVEYQPFPAELEALCKQWLCILCVPAPQMLINDRPGGGEGSPRSPFENEGQNPEFRAVWGHPFAHWEPTGINTLQEG